MTTTADPELPLRYPFPLEAHGTVPPLIDWARAHRPVCPVLLPSGVRVWMVTRADDIHVVLTNPRLSRDLVYDGAPRMVGEDVTSIPGGIFNLDPPAHTRVRAVLNPFYTRRGVRRYRALIRRHANELLDRLAAGPNPADLVAGYTAPLPLRVNSEMLGVPVSHRERFLQNFADQVSLTLTAEQIAEATRQVESFAAEVIAAHRREPDTPIGALIRAHDHGDITADQLQGTVSYLFVTGSEPLVAPLGSGTVTLLRHRQQLDELIDDPLLWPAAVEESCATTTMGCSACRASLSPTSPSRAPGSPRVRPYVPPCSAPPWIPTITPSRTGSPSTAAPTPTPRSAPVRTSASGPASPGCSWSEVWSMLVARLPTLELAVNDTDVPWARDLIFIKPVAVPVVW